MRRQVTRMEGARHALRLVAYVVCAAVTLCRVSPALADDRWAWPFPTSSTITSGFETADRPDHHGVDVGASVGDPIYAVNDGTIIKKYEGCVRYGGLSSGVTCENAGVCSPNHGYNTEPGIAYGYCNHGYGNGICLYTKDGYYVQFAHMSSVNSTLYEGQYVRRGTLLGYVGGSGCATTRHCHYAVSKVSEFEGFVDPMGRPYDYTYDRVPYGSLDLAEAVSGKIRVAGWAVDDDAPDSALGIHVYIDGPADVGTCIRSDIVAGNDSSDVGRHRFDVTFPTDYRGVHQIYVYAINPGEGNHNPVLTGSPRTVDINALPEGRLDEAEGGVGYVRMRGWARDGDAPGEPLYVDLYIGGPAGPGVPCRRCLADSHRTDLGADCGFDVEVPTGQSGTLEVYAYAINRPEGHNPEIGHRTVTVTPDTRKPAIGNVRVTDVSWRGYTVTCDVSDDARLDRVAFPTWTTDGGQDDVIDDWEHRALGTVRDGTATYRVDTSAHGRQTGCIYVTHIYAYDAAGNVASVGLGAWPALEVEVPPAISNVRISDVSDEGYTVTCDVDPEWSATRVEFPSWTTDGGQDDVVWHRGTYSGGTATCRVDASEHGGASSCYYRTHVYAYDAAGNATVAGNKRYPVLTAYVGSSVGDADLALPSSLRSVGEEAFGGLPVESVACPQGLSEIGARAFADCALLRRVSIPASTASIAGDAFAGCPGGLTVFGAGGSEAERLANGCGFTFVEVRDR